MISVWIPEVIYITKLKVRMTLRKYLVLRAAVGKYLLSKRVNRVAVGLFLTKGWIIKQVGKYLSDEPVATFQRIRSIWDPRWQSIKRILINQYGSYTRLWPRNSKGDLILDEEKILKHDLEFKKYGIEYVRRKCYVFNQSDRLL